MTQYPSLTNREPAKLEADRPTSDYGIKTIYSGSKITRTCDTIHIAMVCGGFNSTRSLYVLLKSILFYRSDIIHVHLFVDNISYLIMSELFHTWSPPELLISFYNATEHEHDVAWIGNQHYSHQYGLLKLVFLGVLSEELDKVILLDTDMLAMGNIKVLWKQLNELCDLKSPESPVLGLVENQSDWYLKTSTGSRIVWPAVGRGFNTGLILANLHQLKLRGWNQLWRQTAEIELTTHLVTTLADQDIFNAIIKSHSKMVQVLPCSFNLQLNDNTRLHELCPQVDDFQLIHWNSPYKLQNRNPMSDHFKNWYSTFINWDGSLLRHEYCNQTSPFTKKNETLDQSAILCKDIEPKPSEKLRTYLYFVEFEYSPTLWDVSLVVHLSSDRLQVLDQLAGHWPGPMSVAIYLTEMETSLLLFTVQSSSNLARRKNIGYHLVYRDHGFNYPINKMRNIALNNVITKFVMLSDIDFLPSMNLYEYLKTTIAAMATNTDGESNPLSRRVLVIPAFETVQYKFEFPLNKAELLTQLNLGSISMFREQIWPQGQTPTDYSRWKISTKPYKVDWQLDYEPFIVTTSDVPRFDERFIGFGWNKVESIMRLAALGYEFIVLPEAFLVHKFHSASYDIIRHRESPRYRACMRYLKKLSLHELRKEFPNFFRGVNQIT